MTSASAVISSCRQITTASYFEGDDDGDGSTRIEFNTSVAWPGTVACEIVTGSSPRQCLVTGLTPGGSYYLRITFTDSSGVSGINPEVVGPLDLPACGGDQAAPTLLMLSPRRDAVVGGLETVKIQAFDAGEISGVEVAVDGGAASAAAGNAAYDCGLGCEVYESALDTSALANGPHDLTVLATDAAGNTARLDSSFRVNNAGVSPAGGGALLRRSYGSQLCLDCHNLPTHSSQWTSTTYGNWALDCLTCHTPHRTRNVHLVRETIRTPSSGIATVNFRQDDIAGGSNPQDAFLGDTSGAGNTPYDDGICEVCHTRTSHYRNDASGGDHSHNSGRRCVLCHPHQKGFLGGGTGPGHLAHLSAEYGPKMTCASGNLGCHGSQSPPALADGLGLAATTVCDTCHSPGGFYNGVDSVGESVGAKDHWSDGVYDAGGNLKAGQEKWCVGCHDDAPSVVQGVAAPNVAGDEAASYTYGTGWGFYKTGHGLKADENYPSKGGVLTLAGRPIECDSCHDLSVTHIDGISRTFDCNDRYACAPTTDYGTSYRLKAVGGQAPMVVPRLQSNSVETFRLCGQCHDSGPLTDGSNFKTNFATWSSDAYVNRHVSHLNMGLNLYPADYIYEYDPALIRNSRVTCVTCHNVHGSTRLAMIRDGKLIGREPGLQIWYGNADLALFSSGSTVPRPENIPLSASTGTIWRISSASNVCGGCHGGNMVAEYRCVADGGNGNSACASPYRPPFQLGALQPPILEWTGENGYVNDGAEPENAPAGTAFSFRVKYTDLNNDAPSVMQLWIDKDDDGIYEDIDGDPADEKVDMLEVDSRDVSRWDGKIYGVDVLLYKAGDHTFTYRFHASDGGDTVELPSGSDLTVSVSNNPPTLSWTGEAHLETGGVSPNVGGLGGNYEFRITYTDVDGECPASGDIQVWIDENDNGYEAGERHNLSEDSAGDTDCTDGKVYQLTRGLSTAGSHNYRFYATDGLDTATAEPGPIGDNTVTVSSTANTPPLLEWHAGTCVTQGVKPALGAAGEDFDFAMEYTDPDGCPSGGAFQVWIDLDGGGYSAGEQHDMTEDDPLDSDCTDGKVYRYTTAISPAGIYSYRFYANDGSDDAVGEATATSTVEAIDAVPVYPGPGTPIQDAISHDVVVLVYEGVYTENIRFTTGNGNNSNVTLQSVCGPEVTTIQGIYVDNSATGAILVQGVSNPAIDGFTVTGGYNGIVLNGHLTVKGSIIRNNLRGIYTITTSSVLDVQDTVIRDNVGAGSGAGIFFNSGGPHSISGSVISDNEPTGAGGGIYLQNSGLGLTIEDTAISDNTATSMGGGIYCTRSKLDVSKAAINSNTSGSSGGGLYLKDGSSVTMVNSNVVDNIANSSGGGLFLGNYNNLPIDLTMTNCTTSNNKLTDTTAGVGGGLFNRLSNVSIHNSIFWGNQAAGIFSAHEVYARLGASNTVSFTSSDVLSIQNNFTAVDGEIDFDAACIAADPFFVDGVDGDYHLKSISPAIDQGASTAAPADDIDGDSRPQGDGYDMGSDEVR